MMHAASIIVAAGRGSRMAADENKIFLDLGGRPLLSHTLKPFVDHDHIKQIIIVSAADEAERIRQDVLCHFDDDKFTICAGGSTRQGSVHNGLREVDRSLRLVLVHDGARPYVSAQLIDRVIEAADHHGAAVPGIAVTDSLKRVGADSFVTEAPNRDNLYRIQTPQGFHRDVLKEALETANQSGEIFSDDAGAVQALTKINVKLVEGDPDNIKVTAPSDADYVRWLLQRQG